jgi:1-acyl-sn-glycerol-3-phosphate acyltransferase
MMAVWPSRCSALAKRSLQYIFPFGACATLCGTVFVDRGKKERALETMDNAAKTIKEKKVDNLRRRVFNGIFRTSLHLHLFHHWHK